MADDADAAVPFAQRVQDVEDLVQGLLVQAAEALVDEEGVQPGAARLVGDDVGEAERQGERGEEGLAAGEGGGVALAARPGVDDVQAEAGTPAPARPARRSGRGCSGRRTCAAAGRVAAAATCSSRAASTYDSRRIRRSFSAEVPAASPARRATRSYSSRSGASRACVGVGLPGEPVELGAARSGGGVGGGRGSRSRRVAASVRGLRGVGVGGREGRRRRSVSGSASSAATAASSACQSSSRCWRSRRSASPSTASAAARGRVEAGAVGGVGEPGVGLLRAARPVLRPCGTASAASASRATRRSSARRARRRWGRRPAPASNSASSAARSRSQRLAAGGAGGGAALGLLLLRRGVVVLPLGAGERLAGGVRVGGGLARARAACCAPPRSATAAGQRRGRPAGRFGARRRPALPRRTARASRSASLTALPRRCGTPPARPPRRLVDVAGLRRAPGRGARSHRRPRRAHPSRSPAASSAAMPRSRRSLRSSQCSWAPSAASRASSSALRAASASCGELGRGAGRRPVAAAAGSSRPAELFGAGGGLLRGLDALLVRGACAVPAGEPAPRPRAASPRRRAPRGPGRRARRRCRRPRCSARRAALERRPAPGAARRSSAASRSAPASREVRRAARPRLRPLGAPAPCRVRARAGVAQGEAGATGCGRAGPLQPVAASAPAPRRAASSRGASLGVRVPLLQPGEFTVGLQLPPSRRPCAALGGGGAIGDVQPLAGARTGDGRPVQDGVGEARVARCRTRAAAVALRPRAGGRGPACCRQRSGAVRCGRACRRGLRRRGRGAPSTQLVRVSDRLAHPVGRPAALRPRRTSPARLALRANAPRRRRTGGCRRAGRAAWPRASASARRKRAKSPCGSSTTWQNCSRLMPSSWPISSPISWWERLSAFQSPRRPRRTRAASSGPRSRGECRVPRFLGRVCSGRRVISSRRPPTVSSRTTSVRVPGAAWSLRSAAAGLLAGAGHRAVQREADGVEDGGLARAGRPVQQEEPGRGQVVEVDVLGAAEGAEGGEGQPVQPHPRPPRARRVVGPYVVERARAARPASRSSGPAAAPAVRGPRSPRRSPGRCGPRSRCAYEASASLGGPRRGRRRG